MPPAPRQHEAETMSHLAGAHDGTRERKHAKHGRFRPFRAVPGGLGLRQATEYLKRYNYGFNHLCLRFLLSPDGAFADGTFLVFLGISATNDLKVGGL